MYNALKHAHSGLRWVALLLLITAVLISLMKLISKNETHSAGTQKIFTFNVAFIHIQGLIGIVLLFISPMVTYGEGWMKASISRFYGMEHPMMMVLAMVLITIGNAKAKRIDDVRRKHRTLFIFNFISLLIVLSMIPWPFRALGGNLF